MIEDETTPELTTLTGHASPETAYVVEDYPCGFRARCRKRYWIEDGKRGQRVASQTTNPKSEAEHWRKPKRSTYSALVVLVVNEENGHVESRGLSAYSTLEEVEAFRRDHGHAFFGRQLELWQQLLACKRVGQRITHVIADPDEDPAERAARQAEVKRRIGRAVAVEVARVEAEG